MTSSVIIPSKIEESAKGQNPPLSHEQFNSPNGSIFNLQSTKRNDRPIISILKPLESERLSRSATTNPLSSQKSHEQAGIRGSIKKVRFAENAAFREIPGRSKWPEGAAEELFFSAEDCKRFEEETQEEEMEEKNLTPDEYAQLQVEKKGLAKSLRRRSLRSFYQKENLNYPKEQKSFNQSYDFFHGPLKTELPKFPSLQKPARFAKSTSESKSDKKVRFSDNHTTHEIPNREDLTKEGSRAVFYTNEECKKFEQEVQEEDRKAKNMGLYQYEGLRYLTQSLFRLHRSYAVRQYNEKQHFTPVSIENSSSRCITC